jgi:membrane protease YdiL (CAAX protease family)
MIEQIKMFINRQNPRYIYGLLCILVIIHFLIYYHNLFILSDVDVIRKGWIEFFVILILALQIIIINKYLQSAIKYVVIFVYLNTLTKFYKILNGETEYYNQNNSNWKLIIGFIAVTIISYVFFLIIENTKSKNNQN